MIQPLGFEQGCDLLCKLCKALYVFKHSAYAWFFKLNKCLIQFGIDSSKSNSYLFFQSTSDVYFGGTSLC